MTLHWHCISLVNPGEHRFIICPFGALAHGVHVNASGGTWSLRAGELRLALAYGYTRFETPLLLPGDAELWVTTTEPVAADIGWELSKPE